MRKNTLLLYIFIFLVLLNIRLTRADIPDGHKPTPCFGCHEETLGADYGSGECGNCHYYKLPAGGFNVELLQNEHNPKICKGCHMGNTLVNASERDIFHNGHNGVNCNICHTQDNFTVIKIEGIEKKGFQCVQCHGNQVHGIHIKNITKICPICHGSWAKDKIYIKGSAPSSNASQKIYSLEKFTIFAFIKQILNTIFGVI